MMVEDRSRLYAALLLLLGCCSTAHAVQSEEIFHCPDDWVLQGQSCYRFFNIKHSWMNAAELCKRFGAELLLVDSYVENNFTQHLAHSQLDHPTSSYWLGAVALNELNTNTLESAGGDHVSLYSGFWAQGQPRVQNGKCVRAHLGQEKQSWELSTCESLLPFMCKAGACPMGSSLCSNGKCVNNAFLCDGQNDCGDMSDEMNCESRCEFYMKSSGDSIESPNYPNKYGPNMECQWTLEGPVGHNIVLQFYEFETEKNFDTVQILIGGRTADSAVPIATLSGRQDLSSRLFVSASNFMILKFKSDAAAEKRGFRASWKTEPQSCGGEFIATPNPQVLASPNYPSMDYPGGLECLYELKTQQGSVITIQITDFQMEKDNDYILVRDGAHPSSKILARLTGKQEDNPKYLISTGPAMYLYLRTSFGNSGKGFQLHYYSGCSVTLEALEGDLTSPAYGISNYPNNQECLYLIRRPGGGRLSLKFLDFVVSDKDTVQVYDGAERTQAIRLHPGQGFSASNPPSMTLTADSGTMLLRFSSDPLRNAKGWAAKFSADCHQLRIGEGAIASSRETAFDSVITYSCARGHQFANNRSTIVSRCNLGGMWSEDYIPACQEVYCGPVPQIDNGFSIGATNVSFLGQATYQCYAGFAFPSGSPVETVTCLETGQWQPLPECLASQCPPLPDIPNIVLNVLNGGGRSYGTVIRLECEEGYYRVGHPVIHCMSDGSWSATNLPSCIKKHCSRFPKITNGFVTDMTRKYHFGDEARVQCHRGFRLVGSPLIKCGAEDEFINLPTCEDMDECTTAQCDAASTECMNSPGAFSCKCKKGFLPNLNCRPVGDLGVSDGGIPDDAITVSGTMPGFEKNSVRLNSQPGWCGTLPVPGKNWVMVDLRVPTVVRGLRTQPVSFENGDIAYSTSISLQYSNNLTDAFQNYVSSSGSPVEFHITSGAPLSALNLPEPIEARYIRLTIANFEIAPCLKFELMGCARQDCVDINECEENQGGCGHRCVNSPGSFSCACDIGYDLFVNETTAGFTLEESETGLRDGDTYRLNKTCVPKMCPKLESPSNGLLLDTREMHHFMDVVKFQCDYGFVMQGPDTLECTSTGTWNGTTPECTPAVCHPIKVDGVSVIYDDPESIMVPLGQNVSFACNDVGKPLRNTVTSNFRQCVYDPKDGLPNYWLSGVQPECERRDCGIPAETPGATYGFTADTKFESTFFFGCQETFSFNGQTSRNDNVVRCDANGNWDFGDLRCEGPVCQDPGHPPDGRQSATSYEQGSKVHFDCDRPGYIPITDEPVTCITEPTCKVVKPIGITSGKIPDSAFNVSSERTNYEARNIRLNSATGWCGQEGPFTYVTVDLGSVHNIKVILLKGVITNDVVGRPTELRFFYKVEENADFVIYFPNFNLTKRVPGNYGELAMIKLPVYVKARFIVLAIISHDKNPCMKFELMGCEDTPEETNLLGFDSNYPTCVDNMPPVFSNCPAKPLVVEKGPNGLLPVDFVAPVAKDNSGIITRTEVIPAGFQTPMYIFEDMTVEYLAFDVDGNIAICYVNITVPDDTPPFLACPQSYVIELVDEQETYTVNFNSSLTLANVQASDNHDENVKLSVYPGEAVIRVGDYQNVTVTATDAAGNSAMCSFQVAVKASACVDWELKKPAHGKLACNNDPRRGMVCTAVCERGFRFTDNMPAKEFVCTADDGLWYPTPVVPDCVSEDTQQASYDTVADITYRSNGAVVVSCLDQYKAHVEQFYTELNALHSGRCQTATNIPIKVELVDVGMMLLQENMVKTKLVLRISHTNPQERIYDLCGNVLSLIYDLTLPSSSSEIENILNMPSVGNSCPALRAMNSNVTRGFTCSTGEVLNTETTSIPRCLHCPAGSFAKAMEDKCTPCPMGFYQDMGRQGSCKQCPAGRYTRHNGSKSIEDCIPVCGYGTYSPTGLVPCLNCPQHTFSGEPPIDGFRECQTCPPNTFTFMAGAVSQQQCRQMCTAGTYSDNGLEPCNPCPRNFYQPSQGKMTCVECPTGNRTINEGSTSASECQAIDCTENICQNGGLCLARHHQIQCYCPAGFSGKFCEIDINECDSTPCYNNGKCIDLPQSYRCECLPGYSGLQCQDEESDCVPGACPDRAMCKDNPGIGSFECLCRSGYTGPDCSVTVDPCVERGNPCNNSGVCTPLKQGKFQCECMPGWEGRLCDINTDDCAEMPCLLGAPCTDLVADFKCDCPPGFTGKRCHLKVDLCNPMPCVNGICVDKFFEHECICYEGFTGESCDINIDECADKPCENGGLCIDQVNGYKCSCETGFTGKNCQHMVDYCASDPCENAASCTNALDGFICECRPGFVGLQCEASTDECISSPCNPVGTEECIDLDNMFKCKCHAGFTGELCETNINECEYNPCMNGGTCIDGVADYTCQCDKGWSGKRCEKDVGGCEANPCLNDAECIDLFEDFFCVCPSGTDGKMCQVAPERCVGNPCMNGAQCQDFGSGLNCSCSEDYTGVGCQFEYDACAEGACKNGATCIDHGEGYKCLCPPGYEGRHCDKDIVDCTPAACPPGAVCIDLTNDFYCKCPFNLTGEDCRKVINFDYDLYVNDESKTSSASLATPFDLMEAKAFTVALWVQFAKADSKGIVFTLFSVSSPYIPENPRMLLQATDSSMIIELVRGAREVISYRPNIPINDGQWHHIALIWDGTEGILTLTTDAVVVAQVTGFAKGSTMPKYGWVTLGAVPQRFASYSDVRGFHGRVARLNVWNRAVDYRVDVPKMARSCMKSPVMFEGLLLRWAGYDRVEGNVERVGPSNCGQHVCPLGYTGDCTVLQRDKTPPRVDHCPGHIWVITKNGSAVVNWDRPRFTDNIGIEKTIEKSGYFPGQAFALGTYHIATVAYDAAGNSATCSFNVYVLEDFCEDLADPVGGTQRCSNWGPGGRFKVCSIECNPGLKFSTQVPDFYTCGAEGFWRPTTDPS
ncbi:sushi, von Willebrand factor type A, EGF and pentraxin domain-containing protein 1, partial [Hyalella azteca]|uniref:Sushi, von Willebrand factor type A, EGF and pentraxin domain-containing protein 1 n=1 Tax=Hyalella azteca TaxID=294128 RepID=A0A8B7PM65_HYAAZ